MFFLNGALRRLEARKQEIEVDCENLITAVSFPAAVFFPKMCQYYNLYRAIINGKNLNLANVQFLNLNARLPTTGATPLIAAIVFGNTNAVDYLLEHGADITLRDYRFNANALHWALVVMLNHGEYDITNYMAIAQKIITHITSENRSQILEARDLYGKTPLNFASILKLSDILPCNIEAGIQGASTNHIDNLHIPIPTQ